MKTTDDTDFTDEHAAPSTRHAPNRRKVLDCGSPLPLSNCGVLPTKSPAATDVRPCPKAPEDWRTPRRWRAACAPLPIRALREIRGLLLCALLLLGAGRGAAATVAVTSLADSGPGTLRQAIADASPGDTITFATSANQ